MIAGADDGIRVIGLGLAGRRDQARALLIQMGETSRIPLFRTWIEYLTAWLEGRPADMVQEMAALGALKIEDDPEAIFQIGWLLCDVREYAAGLAHLQRAVQKGYFVAATLSESRQFDALRSTPLFAALLKEAEAGRARARAAFRDAGGDRLIGLIPHEP